MLGAKEQVCVRTGPKDYWLRIGAKEQVCVKTGPKDYLLRIGAKEQVCIIYAADGGWRSKACIVCNPVRGWLPKLEWQFWPDATLYSVVRYTTALCMPALYMPSFAVTRPKIHDVDIGSVTVSTEARHWTRRFLLPKIGSISRIGCTQRHGR